MLQGCDIGDPFKAATTNAVETNTPTGCLKSKGRYYDPKLKTCVQVDNQHQALVLDSYRYVNKLAEEGKLQEVEYVIDFKTYITVQRAESLWAGLREQGAKMLILSATLPTSRGYDSASGQSTNFNTPKVWGGPDVATSCGWDHRFDAPAQSLQEMILEHIKAKEADTSVGARPLPERRKAIFEDKDCRVESMWIMANPTVMRDFWNRHLDDIEGIQPQITTLDLAQPALGPTQPLKERE
jgi:hypothetical protein